MPEPNPQLEQELAAQPVAAAPSVVGAAPAGAMFSPSMASAVRAFHAGQGGVAPGSLGATQVTALQRSAGNQAVMRLVSPSAFSIARQPHAGMAPPAPAPAPGPAGPVPQTPTGPTPQDPSSGVDWDAWWTSNAPNVIRTFLEVARMYPGWGLLAGGAADIMNARQDFAQIQGQNAPEIEAFIAGRHAVAIINNGLGHVIYVVELIQDIATASVIGVEIDGVTVPLNQLLLSAKVGIDGVQFLADFGLTCAAQYQSMKAPPGPAGDASRAAWDGMVANYEANLVGDLVGGIMDIVDLASAGFSNAQPIKQGATAVKEVFTTAKLLKTIIPPILQGWFGVWGGKAFERDAPGGGVHGIAEAVAGQAIYTELQRIKACYTVGDAMIGAAADHISKQLAELNQAATIAMGGRDPFVTARDAAVEGLGHLEQRIGDLMNMGVMASSAQEKSAAITAWCDEQVALIDSVQIPNIEIPDADVGEGALADLAEGALNMAGDVAGAGLQLMVDQLNAGVDEIKSTLKPPLQTIKGHSTDLGTFMQIVTNEAREQAAAAQTKVTDVKTKLQKCNSFEDVVNMVVNQILEMVGLEADFEVDDIRQLWADIGTQIDEAIVWAENLRDGRPIDVPRVAPGTPAEAGADGAGAAGATGAPGGAGGAGGGTAGAGGDPTAGVGTAAGNAAASAASSPPSAPPSGAAAGRDLQQPGAAAAAVGGGGAAAVDPAAFTGGGAGGGAGGAAASAVNAAQNGAAGAAAAGAQNAGAGAAGGENAAASAAAGVAGGENANTSGPGAGAAGGENASSSAAAGAAGGQSGNSSVGAGAAGGETASSLEEQRNQN